MKDRFSAMKYHIWLLGSVIQYDISFPSQPIGQTLKQILSKWPARSDLDNIKMDIKAMEDDERLKAKQSTNADEMKMEALPGLEKIEKDIKKLDEERVKVPLVCLFDGMISLNCFISSYILRSMFQCNNPQILPFILTFKLGFSGLSKNS